MQLLLFAVFCLLVIFIWFHILIGLTVVVEPFLIIESLDLKVWFQSEKAVCEVFLRIFICLRTDSVDAIDRYDGGQSERVCVRLTILVQRRGTV